MLGGSFDVLSGRVQQLLDLLLNALTEFGYAHDLEAGTVLQRKLLHNTDPDAEPPRDFWRL
jgi:hypothetical protein